MIMTFAGTWFGIGVFYTILYQLFLALFNSSAMLENVRLAGRCVCVGGRGAACLMLGKGICRGAHPI